MWDRTKVVDFAVKIDGWMDRNELEWLYDRASEVPPGGIWVEIGCWKGRSLFATAMGLPVGTRLIAVDTFRGDSSSANHWDGREVPGWLYDNVQIAMNAVKTIRDTSYPDIRIWTMESVVAARMVRKGISAVFIDGQHDYSSISADIEAWKPLIHPGGLFSGHDGTYPDVLKAVRELVPNFQMGPKTIWYSRIPS